LILILIYFELRDTENQQLRLAVSHTDIIVFDDCIRILSDILCDFARSSRSLISTQAQIVSKFCRCPLLVHKVIAAELPVKLITDI